MSNSWEQRELAATSADAQEVAIPRGIDSHRLQEESRISTSLPGLDQEECTCRTPRDVSQPL